MRPTPQPTTPPAVLGAQQASRDARAVGLRRLAPVLVYAAVLLWAGWWVDCRSLWILFGVAPVLLLDQYVFRLLPWPKPKPKASGLLLRAAVALVGGVGCYLCNRPYVYFWDTLFVGVVLTLGVSLIGSMVDLGSALWRLWRKQPNGPPGRLAAAVAVIAIVLAMPASAPLLFFHLIHQPPYWTPADDGYEFEEVTVTAGDGLALSGWLIPCPDAVGSVIYCHGHGSNRTQIRPLVPLFRKSRLNVLAFDFRGHGASPGHTATFGAEVEDVIGAEAFLRQRFPDQPIVLCGISYGASICVQALPRLPHVKGAWIESGFARLGDMASHPFGAVPEGVRTPILRFYNVVLWLDAGFSALDVKPIDHLKDASVPIFFCHARGDDYIPFRQGEEMFEAYSGPKDHYWSPYVGHGMDTNSDEYGKRFHDFFARCLAAPLRARNERRLGAAPGSDKTGLSVGSKGL